MTQYAELHCLSNFTFLRGASHPEELVARAHALGYAALAITDECSLAGVVRAHGAAKALGLKLLIGAEIRLADGPQLVLLATNRTGYGNLSELITRGRRSAAKGSTPSQTAWALLGLMAAGEVADPAVERGVDFLRRAPRSGPRWHERWWTGTGFPRVFYLKYHGYSAYFPLWALARYRNLIRSNERKVAWGM